MTTDNCKLNFDIQIHMYSMYLHVSYEEIHVQKWGMYMYKRIRIILCCVQYTALNSTSYEHVHVVINMESQVEK